MRLAVTLLTLIGGAVLSIVTYFFLATPLGIPTAERFSNPRVPFAATLFILGVMLVFISAVVYELLPDSNDEPETDELQA